MKRMVSLVDKMHLGLRSLAAISLVSVFFAVNVMGNDEDGSALLSLMNSSDWFCKYEQKVNLNHLSDGSIAKVGVSFASIRCIYSGPGTHDDRRFTGVCRAAAPNTILSLEDCMVAASKDGHAGHITWGEAAKAPEKSSGVVDKWGRRCTYNFQPHQLSRHSEKVPGRFDWLCATPISCDNYDRGPKHFIVACDGVGSTKLNGREVVECPNVVDCVENELPLTPAFTATELTQSRAHNTSQLIKASPAFPMHSGK